MTIVKEKWRRFIRCPLSHSLFIPPSRQIQSVDDPRLCSVMNNNVWHRCFDMKNVIFNSCGAKREQRKIHRNGIFSAALHPGRRAMTVFIPGLQPSLQTSHFKTLHWQVVTKYRSSKGMNSSSSCDADVYSHWYFQTCLRLLMLETFSVRKMLGLGRKQNI